MAQHKILDQDQIRRLALAMPEAQESSHQGRPDFRVREKIFATLPPDKGIAVFKITPADLDLLVQSDPTVFRDAWGGRWIGVDLARVDPDLLHKLLIDAWCLAAPKTLVRAYQTNNPQG